MSKELQKSAVKNTKVKDNGIKLIFEDPILCSQFFRGYVDIELLKDVQPEDIEDISERFLPMWQEGRDSDSVKKISLKDTMMFVITIVEHQSEVHFDMAFRILRYIVMVLTDYAAEQEKLHPGITKTKDFKYPPIIPIVYYEGTQEWTAVRNFRDRVHMGDTLGEFIPNFEYFVMPLHKYSNQDLIEKEDQLSLIMLVNKLKNSSEFKNLKDIPETYFEKIQKETPEYLLERIGKIIAVFLYRLNIPRKEVEDFTDLIERREFSMLFDSFEAYDVQETRRVSREKGREEGREEGRIGFIVKLQKQYTVPEIAKMLEEDEETIQKICDIAEKYAPDYDAQKICEEYLDKEPVVGREK